MNDNEFERTARVWLEEGPTSMTDRALKSALDEIHVTRQRRVMALLRRFTAMGNTFRLAALTAAIVLATVVGVPRFFPSGGGGLAGAGAYRQSVAIALALALAAGVDDRRICRP